MSDPYAHLPDENALRAELGRIAADRDRLAATVGRVEALAGGPTSQGYQPYAVEVAGEVQFAVLLDDLRAALDGDSLTTPKRIQRSRAAGWRMPAGAVYVGRPSKWGNPFMIHTEEILVHADGRDWWCPTENGGARAAAVDLFRVECIPAASDYPPVADIRRELAGRDLACWCPLDDGRGNRFPCHADVLLELANPGWTP